MFNSYRYTHTKLKLNENGKRCYKTTIYPAIFEETSDIVFVSKVGDRLDLYAKKYYNDVNMYWIIAQANHIGKGTLNVEPGITIRIPKNISKIIADLENLQSG